MPQSLSPSSSGRRRSSASNSPEFEFWMVRNPVSHQPDLLSADELFVDGVLLPLELLHLHPNHNNSGDQHDNRKSDPENSEAADSEMTRKSDPGQALESDVGPRLGPGLTVSKRWRDIFKKGDRKNKEEREKKRERKASGGGSGAGAAELNINLWPFSRSRSAGNGGIRPRMAATRKVSSAPCSRSNSAGESKSRKWPSSPSRGGVHLGRSSPVWQIRRAGRSSDAAVVKNAEKGAQKEGNEFRRQKPAGVGVTKARVLNLNVPTCIGYRQHLSCRSDESSAVSIAAVGDGTSGGPIGGSGAAGDSARGSNLFNLRSLFTKKVF